MRTSRCAPPPFAVWGSFFAILPKTPHSSPHFTQGRTFPPQWPAPLTHAEARRFSVLPRDCACPPGPGLPLSPSSDDCFGFFLLVSSNTYIVWGETGSIHTPQKAIHSRAAGEAQCSPCPLHSWMSFVQSSGLESFPSQSQAINERWKKERKCRRVLSLFLHSLFFLCSFVAELCCLVALEGFKSIFGKGKGNYV